MIFLFLLPTLCCCGSCPRESDCGRMPRLAEPGPELMTVRSSLRSVGARLQGGSGSRSTRPATLSAEPLQRSEKSHSSIAEAISPEGDIIGLFSQPLLGDEWLSRAIATQ